MTAGGAEAKPLDEARMDQALRRFEHDAVLACLAMAVVGFAVTAVWRGWRPALGMALGVLAGGLLMAWSYRAIKGGVDVVLERAAHRAAPFPVADDQQSEQDFSPAHPPTRQQSEQDFSPAPPAAGRAFLAVKFFTRYALLAVAAYVMLTCFRLHPVGLVVGATSPFVAALLQVGRLSRSR